MLNITEMIKILYYKLKYFFQRRFRGWDDREIYNLDYTIFVLLNARLKRFKELTTTYPIHCNSLTDWKNEIQVIIDNIEEVVDSENWYFNSNEVYAKKEKVALWLSKNILNLWF